MTSPPPQQSYAVGILNNVIFQKRKLRQRKIRYPAQGPTVGKSQMSCSGGCLLQVVSLSS